MALNERCIGILRAISESRNGIKSADGVAAFLGYRPARTGRLAVSSSLRSLQRAGLVGRIPPQDRWDHADYFLTDDGEAELKRELGMA